MKQNTKFLYKVPFIGKYIKTRNEKLQRELMGLQFDAEKPVREIEPDMFCDFLILNSLPLSDFNKKQFKHRYDYHIYKLYEKLFECKDVRTIEDVEKIKKLIKISYTGWEKFFVCMMKEYVIKTEDAESLNKYGIRVNKFDDSMKAQNLACAYDVSNITAKPVATITIHSNFERYDDFKIIILFDNNDFIVENVYGLSMYIEHKRV
jgi:hypothetical protein